MKLRYIEVLAPKETEREVLDSTAGLLNGLFNGSTLNRVCRQEGKDRVEVLLHDVEQTQDQLDTLKTTVFDAFGGQADVFVIDPKTNKVLAFRRCFAAAH